MTPVLNEVEDASILKTGSDARYRRPLLWLPRAPVSPPRSGLSRSDFVLWPTADQRVHRGMSATDQSRHQHPIPAPHTLPHRPRHAACRTGMWWVVRNSSIQSLDYRNGTSPLAPPTYIAGFSSYLDVQAGASPHWVHCVLLGSLLTTWHLHILKFRIWLCT